MCCPVPPAVRTRRQGLPDPELFRGSHWRGRAFLGSLSRWRCEMLRAQRMNSSLICTSSHLIISIFFFLNAGCSPYAPVWQVGEAHSSPFLLVEEGIGHRCSTSRTKRSLCAGGAGVTALSGGLARGSGSWASAERSRWGVWGWGGRVASWGRFRCDAHLKAPVAFAVSQRNRFLFLSLLVLIKMTQKCRSWRFGSLCSLYRAPNVWMMFEPLCK